MNVANMMLCEQLYALSGWNDTDAKYTYLDETGEGEKWELKYGSPSWATDTPAYSLSYLLRKLPKPNLSAEYSSPDWRCQVMVSPHEVIREYADTPEDATCKLVITLIKKGLLDAQQN